ncbi:E2/UBC family protein [Christiangramia sp. ASW11-125]|uniref:E2/UBC family protein n=1 Tax=Christiangramia sp. ASW11-125 TaxID=3400701 RepID=UPI003AAD8E07
MKPVKLWVQFPSEYPVVFPRVFVSKVDYPKFEFGPHVESDGKICLFSNQAQPIMTEPVRVLKEALNRAHTILEEALEEIPTSAYEEEFESYWSQTYGKKDQVEYKYLIIAEKPLGKFTQVLLLDKNPISLKKVIYQDEALIKPFKEMLQRQNIKYNQYPVFVFGELPFFRKPPFHLTNIQLKKNLENFDSALYKNFINFYNQNPDSRFFIFQKVINETTRYFGWRHQPLRKVTGFQAKTVNEKFEFLLKVKPTQHIIRIYPQVYSISRLMDRSVGLPMTEAPSYTIAGLGSIGSHLIHFLDGPGILLHLIDTDYLSLENTGRHLLGFQYINWKKTEALKDYLTLRHPLRSIKVKTESVLEVLEKDSNFIQRTNALFVCIGEYNKEQTIAKALQYKIFSRPTFLLWVEPYGIAGHCIFLHPENPDYQRYHNNGNFIHSLIEDLSHEALAKQEAGCQSIYTPYAPNSVQFFLGALVPHITKILKNPDAYKTHVFSWIGNLEIAKELEITLKAETANYYFGEKRIIE